MRKRIRLFVTLALAFAAASCEPNRPPAAAGHNPDAAVIVAVEFAKEAFVDLDQPAAYKYLTDGMRRRLTEDDFIGLIAQMHPSAFPQVVTATAFEPVHGREAVYVWLDGEGGGRRFFYRLILEGAADRGYRIAGLRRYARRPDDQPGKPLPIQRSTAELEP